MVNRANGTRANGHRANGNRADVVAPYNSRVNAHEKTQYLLFYLTFIYRPEIELGLSRNKTFSYKELRR